MKKAKDRDTSSADSLISMTYSTPRICSLKEAGSHVLKFGTALLGCCASIPNPNKCLS